MMVLQDYYLSEPFTGSGYKKVLLIIDKYTPSTISITIDIYYTLDFIYYLLFIFNNINKNFL